LHAGAKGRRARGSAAKAMEKHVFERDMDETLGVRTRIGNCRAKRTELVSSCEGPEMIFSYAEATNGR
jgi:hypothetical protein